MTIGTTTSNEVFMNNINDFDILRDGKKIQSILFQNGARMESGSIPGAGNEDLLFILIERLATFQKGHCSCFENELALEHLRKALEHLQAREKERLSRGVLGTNKK